MSRALRPFRRPWLWFGGWLALVALVVAASLMPAGNLPPAPFENVDKIEHFLAYAVLAAGAVMLFQRRGMHAALAIALIGLGVGLEFAQGALTAARTASVADALANLLGVLAGWALGWTRLRFWLQKVDARLP
ncbi:VanZ family protein [Marilutibacter alkalisoli]|uniref:VanZ family protein n=1 Tax=Marilutibacter alkalisoli TaxID=2591633 RepID=A0A514BNA5_9GAMM|nr:VanZ family protein [Lysobacter alkalisoli]QDH68876.1 VanZ family protein [Lysobacter alkalisoli]